MMKLKNSCDCAGWGLFVLRLTLGLGFLFHGLQKLGNMEGSVGFFASLGLGVAIAWVVAIAETLAGAMMILGFMTRFAGYAMAVIMIVAIFVVHLKVGYLNPGGYELNLIYFASALSIALSGPGKWALDIKMMKNSCDDCEGCKNVCTMHETPKQM